MIGVIIILAVLAVVIKFILFPPVKQLPTTGQYQITSVDYWVTENRSDPYFDDRECRQLQVRRWYPIDCTEDKPVIVASHGSCGTIDNNVSLYRELASHGYTVLAVVHPGQAASVKYEDGGKNGPNSAFLKEMSALEEIVFNNGNLSDDELLASHIDWAKEFLPKYGYSVSDSGDIRYISNSSENAEQSKNTLPDKSKINQMIRDEIGLVFCGVLEDAGVYKQNPDGIDNFMKFINTL